MSYFEEFLRLGEWLSQDDRRALYKYLLLSNKETYEVQANLLLKNTKLNKTIANGEIHYLIKNGRVNYIAREIASDEFTPEMREIKLTGFHFIDLARLRKFFAQSDVDVIQNYPLPGENPQTEGGFGIDAYPYYSLAYYSNGRNRLSGLVKKLRTNDRKILTKLRTL
jgi:hypothetical protein